MALFFSFFLPFAFLFSGCSSFIPPFPQRWRVVSVIEKARIFFFSFFFKFQFQCYGQLGWYNQKDNYIHPTPNDGEDVIIQAGPDSNIFLAFAAKGRFGTCARDFAARTVFHPPPLPLPLLWQFILKEVMKPAHTCPTEQRSERLN